jgi:hypothetical protein
MTSSSYRIYLLDEEGRVDNVQVVSAPGDERAVEVAFSLVWTGARHRNVEVWAGQRCVFAHDVFIGAPARAH